MSHFENGDADFSAIMEELSFWGARLAAYDGKYRVNANENALN